MNKRYDLLDELRECYLQEREFRRNNVVVMSKNKVKLLLRKLYEYYVMNEFETGDIHGQIFSALYIEEFKSYDEVALKFYIHISTLDNYRKRYNRLAEKMIVSPKQEDA